MVPSFSSLIQDIYIFFLSIFIIVTCLFYIIKEEILINEVLGVHESPGLAAIDLVLWMEERCDDKGHPLFGVEMTLEGVLKGSFAREFDQCEWSRVLHLLALASAGRLHYPRQH